MVCDIAEQRTHPLGHRVLASQAFWVTIAFGLVYLAWYPGLGTWKGGGWTSVAQYEDEMRYAERLYGPIYQRFAATDIKALAADPQARAAGEKLFLNYCTQCHASDARGGKGFPNLTDTDWLYGGDPQTIEKTILDGRNGMMPAWGPVLKEEGVRDAANYVRSLSGLAHDAARAERGKTLFATYCAACHGPDGKGNIALGAPNLTDNIWLWGGSQATITETVTKGRRLAAAEGTTAMPAFKDTLGDDKIRLVAAYVWSLSNPAAPAK